MILGAKHEIITGLACDAVAVKNKRSSKIYSINCVLAHSISCCCCCVCV